MATNNDLVVAVDPSALDNVTGGGAGGTVGKYVGGVIGAGVLGAAGLAAGEAGGALVGSLGKGDLARMGAYGTVGGIGVAGGGIVGGWALGSKYGEQFGNWVTGGR